MYRKFSIVAAMLVIVATIVIAAGCGGSSTITSSQSSTSNTQSATGSTSTDQPGQGQTQGQPNGQPEPRMDNARLLARVAEILNVSVDKLTTAYNNAMPKRTDSAGAPPSGRPPMGTPPAGVGTPPTGTPPAGGQQRQPGEFSLPDDIIQKIATELGLTADKVSGAFKQAMSELQASSTK